MSPILKSEMIEAMHAYRNKCHELITAHQRATLSPEWTADEHGEHCRFEHLVTGQVIEAPFALTDEWFYFDPYFLGVFIKTCAEFPQLKASLKHEFHDTIKLLDALKEEGVDISGLNRPRQI